jgi:hypothetical protein
MTHQPHRNSPNLQEITTRNTDARAIVAGFVATTPTLADVWRHVQKALADTPTLVEEINALRAELTNVRLDWANLVAAMRATINAHHDGENDPLPYLRDELLTQGYGDGLWGRP